jgi:hypothetical protein
LLVDIKRHVLCATASERAGDGLQGLATRFVRRVLIAFVRLGGDDVEAVLDATAAQGDVALLAIELLGAEHEGAPGGHALALVAGDRVAVVDHRATARRAVVEIGRRQTDPPAVVRFELKLSSLLIEAHHDGSRAVEDTETAGGAQRDDMITYGELPSGELQFRGAETSAAGHQDACLRVELDDVVTAGRDHDGFFPGSTRSPPVSDESAVSLASGAGNDDAAVLVVGLDATVHGGAGEAEVEDDLVRKPEGREALRQRRGIRTDAVDEKLRTNAKQGLERRLRQRTFASSGLVRLRLVGERDDIHAGGGLGDGRAPRHAAVRVEARGGEDLVDVGWHAFGSGGVDGDLDAR